MQTESWPLVVWAARLSVYFLAQGALVLLAYAYYGFDSDPDSFALGFRIDPILAARQSRLGAGRHLYRLLPPALCRALRARLRRVLYVLAVLGTFTPTHLGMMLNDRVNLFHWLIVLRRLGGRALRAMAEAPPAAERLMAAGAPPRRAACPWA